MQKLKYFQVYELRHYLKLRDRLQKRFTDKPHFLSHVNVHIMTGGDVGIHESAKVSNQPWLIEGGTRLKCAYHSFALQTSRESWVEPLCYHHCWHAHKNWSAKEASSFITNIIRSVCLTTDNDYSRLFNCVRMQISIYMIYVQIINNRLWQINWNIFIDALINLLSVICIDYNVWLIK